MGLWRKPRPLIFEKMYPTITLFNYISIPTYGLSFLIGYVLAVIIARLLCKEYKSDILYAAIYMMLGIGAGAKIMFVLSRIPKLVMGWSTFVSAFEKAPFVALSFVFGGLTFYGGLFGAILALWIYCKQYKVNMQIIAHAMTPCIPLAHAFGRIGCFMAGCCYGREYNGPLAVCFPFNENVPELSEVPRFPVQLLEAFLDIVLFVVLLILRKKIVNAYRLLGIYLLGYAIIRFADEYLRGDVDRGVYHFFSTSQIISIILLPIAIFVIVRSKNTVIEKERQEN